MTVGFKRNTVVMNPGDSAQIWPAGVLGRINVIHLTNPNSIGYVNLIIYAGVDVSAPIIVDIAAKPLDSEAIPIMGGDPGSGILMTDNGMFATMVGPTNRGHACIVI